MKNKRYNAVVIGCGRIGAEEWNYQNGIRPATHAAAYWNHPGISLVGLCDNNSRKLKKVGRFFPDTPLYLSPKKMLEETKPDIVSIATNPDTHYKFVKMAANSGAKAIICEKPISDSLAKSESMVKICKSKGCLLFIGHLRHFDPLIKKWQEKVRNGSLGSISQINCLYYNGFLNNGTHVIDILRWFLGDIKWVSGFYNLETSNPEKDKNIDAIICFKNKSRAIIQSLPKKIDRTEWVFYGTKGKLEIRKLGMEIKFNDLIMGKARSLMTQMVSHVISCIDGKEKPLSTGQDGLAILKILLAVKKSAENNGKVITMVR